MGIVDKIDASIICILSFGFNTFLSLLKISLCIFFSAFSIFISFSSIHLFIILLIIPLKCFLSKKDKSLNSPIFFCIHQFSFESKYAKTFISFSFSHPVIPIAITLL